MNFLQYLTMKNLTTKMYLTLKNLTITIIFIIIYNNFHLIYYTIFFFHFNYKFLHTIEQNN